MVNDKQQEMLKKIDQAISNLRRGKKKLSISKIAEKAEIARKTIYNRPELKQRCEQAIHIQEEQNRAGEEVAASSVPQVEKNRPLTGRKLLEERYRRSREDLKLERERNAKLLENNRQLVLEKAELKNRIQMLQQQADRLNAQKVKSLKK
ncbi:hypothetical protein FH966_04470 [Lentibacillus cibarius]|uniref:Uncharacterized protein n=1 Tax=Lentibacillus cibarius TaxID=2583219 RepID=A0A549YGM3_9BACI|nr:hypothetical protein [Lentibacillus cibarius]TRM11039.1 hypothetical protein FH966_04470 [Lentibacillus cibarius]